LENSPQFRVTLNCLSSIAASVALAGMRSGGDWWIGGGGEGKGFSL